MFSLTDQIWLRLGGARPMSEPSGIESSMGEGHSELRVASTEGPPAWTLDALAHAAHFVGMKVRLELERAKALY
jgi:hypothetical protein